MRALEPRSLVVLLPATASAGCCSRGGDRGGDADTDADTDADADCGGEVSTDGELCACWDVGPRSVRTCWLACDSGADCVDEGQGTCCAPGDRNAGICTPGGCACAFCE